MMRFFNICLVLLFVLQLSAQEGGWVDLFNGENLDGWVKLNGTAEYTIEGDAIVGITTTGTPNTFLATDQEYGNFILEMDVWVDPSINSGIQFRSNSIPDYHKGRVHGYQFELDPSDRKWSGGIYDEARRGWIYPLTENVEGQEAFTNGKWNHIRIEAIGPYIKTWINDVQCSNLVDDLTAQGFIALQVHSIGKEADAGKKMKWKNIRIKTTNLSKSARRGNIHLAEYNYMTNQLTNTENRKGWRLLWNGKNLDGWKPVKGDKINEKWTIRDGVLAINKTDNYVFGGGDIVTEQLFSDFELIVDFKISDKANSGIKYFLDPGLLEKGEAIGLEFQILDDNLHPDAKKGKNKNRTTGSLYDLIPAENLSEKSNKRKRFFKNQWNRARIVVRGSHVEHWLNNVKIIEYNRHSPVFRALIDKSKYEKYTDFAQIAEGHILLQDHGDTVQFKNVKIREL